MVDMVKKDEKENEGIITVGILGLMVYVAIRLFAVEYSDIDILIYPMVVMMVVTLVFILVPMKIVDKMITPKLAVVMGYMAIGGFTLYFLSNMLNIEFLIEIDLILLSLGVIITRFIEFRE